MTRGDVPTIKDIIKKIDTLPAMPDVITQLITLTADENANLDEILELIEKDQALTAKLLRLCNSSYYGLSKQVTSIRSAVVLLGFKTVYKITVGLGTQGLFKNGLPGYDLTADQIWSHAFGTAIASEAICRKIDAENSPGAYTGGLLHDCGKLLVAEHIVESLSAINQAIASGTPAHEAENNVIGADHGMVGGRIGREWKFPESLINAIKYHHDPELAKSNGAVALSVYVGNLVAHRALNDVPESAPNKIKKSALERAKLSDADVEDLEQMVQVEVQKTRELFSSLVT